MVKKTDAQRFSNPRRKGIWALDIDEGDEVVAARLSKQVNKSCCLPTMGWLSASMKAKCVRWDAWLAASKGSTLRDENDYIVGCEVVNGDESILVVCENGFGKRSQVEDFRQTNRGGVGVRSIITSERNGNVVGALCVTDNDGMVMMSSSGQTVRISMRDLRVMGRNTQGVKLVNLRDENDTLMAVQKLEGDASENVTVQLRKNIRKMALRL